MIPREITNNTISIIYTLNQDIYKTINYTIHSLDFLPLPLPFFTLRVFLPANGLANFLPNRFFHVPPFFIFSDFFLLTIPPLLLYFRSFFLRPPDVCLALPCITSARDPTVLISFVILLLVLNLNARVQVY